MPNLASARSGVEPFHAMDVLAEANRLRSAGRSIISMAVGEPGDPPPRAVIDAAEAMLRNGRIGYTDAPGTSPLRERIARHYAERYGVVVPPERVVVTTGSSAGFSLAFLAMFDPGDRVAIARPGYPAYRNIMRALGIDVQEIDLDGGPCLTASHLEAAHRRAPLKGVLFASPANPTGSVTPALELRRLLAKAAELDIAAISDEIYHGLTFGEAPHSALEFHDGAVVVNSFSKYYCMTGWRIGWMVLPPHLVRPVERLAQSLYISPPGLSQAGALAAFEARAELEAVKERYARNRALLAESLRRLGFRLAAPMDGAFYAYADISALTADSMSFCRELLVGAGVAITPGRDFDPVSGHRYVRLSYAGEEKQIAEALDRIEAWLASRPG